MATRSAAPLRAKIFISYKRSGTTVFISPWSLQSITNYICAHLPFNLTLEEWRQYLPGEPYRKTCPNLP